MAKTFDAGVAELLKKIAGGELTGEVEYNQEYAQRQHETLEYEHPQGGEAKYLEKALKQTYPTGLKRVAATVLDDGGQRGMEEAVEMLVLESSKKAPIGPPAQGGEELAAKHPGLLRSSGHARVYEGGKVVFDRPGAGRQEG